MSDTDETIEEWRAIAGFPEYSVSDLGRVKSHARTVVRGSHLYRKKEIIVRTPHGGRGYPCFNVRRNGVTKHLFVHQVVMATFVGPCPAGEEIRHRDGNPMHIALTNLVYGTRAQNIGDARGHGTFPHVGNFGPSRAPPTTKITIGIARQIFLSVKTAKQIAGDHGVTRGNIYAIWDRRIWKAATINLPSLHRGKRGADWYIARGFPVPVANKEAVISGASDNQTADEL